MSLETILLPVVRTAAHETLQDTAQILEQSDNKSAEISMRVALNPFAKADYRHYSAHDAIAEVAETQSPQLREAATWAAGSISLARRMLHGQEPFTTLNDETLQVLCGESRSNRGLNLTLVAQALNLRREWTRSKSYHNVANVWAFSGTIAVSGARYAAEGATKGPNGGGFLLLDLLSS